MVQQTIKEINQSLVDDFLVATDKIGAANFFWSFPSKAYQDQINIRDSFAATKSHLEQSIHNYSEQIQESKRLRIDPDRDKKLARLDELKTQDAQLNAQLDQLKFNDPDEIKKILQQAEANKEAANRWIDNIFAIRKFLTKKKGLATKEVSNNIYIEIMLVSCFCVIFIVGG